MNKSEFIDLVATKAGITKLEACEAIDAIFDGITEALKQGDKITFFGFGTFSVSSAASKPRTGESIKIAASKQTKFKAGKALKDALSGTDDPGPSIKSKGN